MTLTTCQSRRRPARDGFYCTRHALLEIAKAGAWLIGAAGFVSIFIFWV